MPPLRPPIVVVAPDSFKGSLAAPAVCAAIARGLRRVWPDAEIRALLETLSELSPAG